MGRNPLESENLDFTLCDTDAGESGYVGVLFVPR
jgi:hypothetical protein